MHHLFPRQFRSKSDRIDVSTSANSSNSERAQATKKGSILKQFRDKFFRSHSTHIIAAKEASGTLLSDSTSISPDKSTFTELNIVTKNVPLDLTQVKHEYETSLSAVLRMTPEDIVRVQSSWDLLKKNMEQIGVVFFLDLLQQHSDFRNAFTVYRGRPMSEIRHDPNVTIHALLVLNTFDKLISRLDDLEAFEGIIMPLGSKHCDRTPRLELFKHTTEELFNVIKDKLEEQGELNDRLRELWHNVAMHVANCMIYALSTQVHTMASESKLCAGDAMK